jgi:glycosyltransferase involved in cell wall biosynthesis
LGPKPLLVHVITRFCIGGAQLHVLNIGRELSDEYRFHMVCGPDVGQEGSIYEEVAAEFDTTLMPILRRPIRPLEDVRALGALRRLFDGLQPAIVHTHSSKAGILGRRAAQGVGAGVVHTVHGWGHTPDDSALKRRSFIAAERMAASWCDRLVAVSSDTRDEGLSHGIGRPDQYAVIPAYVDYGPSNPDPARARADARASLSLPADAEVVGWVGRFMPQKDPSTLALAVVDLLRRRPDALVCFIGDGPLRDEVEAELGAAGLLERARFAGFRSDVRSLYPAFDVLLHTSRWEGQPRVIQEAVAERVPVVTARVAGTRDVFAAGAVGFEVEPGDAQAFASRAEEALAGSGPRYPLPARDVAAVARANGGERAVQLHRELYADLLAGGVTNRERVSPSG